MICVECDMMMMKVPFALDYIKIQVKLAVQKLSQIASSNIEVIIHANRIQQVRYTGNLKDFLTILDSEFVTQAAQSNNGKLSEAMIKFSKVYNAKKEITIVFIQSAIRDQQDINEVIDKI